MKKFIVIVIFVVSFLPTLVGAQTPTTSTDLPTYSGVDSSITNYLCTPSDPPDGQDLVRCINKMYRFGITAGALVLVLMLIIAGYIYITSGETGKGRAKAILMNSMVGMGILIGSYALLYFINPDLTTFKPIQPPIFSASLPSCDKVGLGDNCIVADGDDSTSNGGSGWGDRIPCPAGQIVSAKSLGLPTKAADERICKPFGEKLLGLKTSLSGIAWRITDTIGTGHQSSCHKENTPLSGTCADIGLEPADRTDANWNKVCKAVLAIGQLQPINEVIGAGTRLPDCPKEADYKRTGSNVHVNWRNGGGGGGGSTSGGSRPNCLKDSTYSFLCKSPSGSYPGDDRYPSKVITSTDSTIQANLTEVKKRLSAAGIDINSSSVKQVYRPHEYSAHLRSLFEASALIQGWSDERVRTTGYYCDGTIQYVKKSDIDKLSQKDKDAILAHAGKHDFGRGQLGTPTTCLSDHGFGYAVDVSGVSPATMEKFGLCRNLNGNKWNQGVDTPHYVLKEKNRNNQGCK